MAFFKGESGRVEVQNQAVGVVTSWTATVTREAYETTRIGTNYRQYAPGMLTTTGTVEFIYDTGDSGGKSIISKLASGSTARLELFNDKTKNATIETTVFLNSVEASAIVGEIATMTATFTATGSITIRNPS